MNNLPPDATVAEATEWLTANVPGHILAGMLAAAMSYAGDTANAAAVRTWTDHSSEQVRQFEDWSIAQRINTWSDGSPT